MTQFEQIKSCNIDELADCLSGAICGIISDCPIGECSCHDCIKGWLQQEVEVDE